MPILTKAVVTKGEPSTFTLNKSQIILVPKVSNNAFFSDITNWKRVSIQFKNTEGQEKVLVFDALEDSPTATFQVTEKARSDYKVTRIIIRDFDDGKLVINRKDLSPAIQFELDVQLEENLLQ
jgi:hypothetical protein